MGMGIQCIDRKQGDTRDRQKDEIQEIDRKTIQEIDREKETVSGERKTTHHVTYPCNPESSRRVDSC